MVKLLFGFVDSRDLEAVAVRVRLPDLDDRITPPLKAMAASTLENKFYYLPDEKEQVACLVDEESGEGVLLGAIYSEADEAPVKDGDKWHMRFKDGAVLEYDRKTHELVANLGAEGKATVTAGAGVTIDGDTTIKGKLTVDGDAAVTGKVDATGDVSSDGTVSGLSGVKAGPEVGGVSLLTHMHPTAAVGPPSPPTPGT